VRDSKGKERLVAVADDMIPLIYWEGDWELASPFIAELIKRLSTRYNVKDHADSQK